MQSNSEKTRAAKGLIIMLSVFCKLNRLLTMYMLYMCTFAAMCAYFTHFLQCCLWVLAAELFYSGKLHFNVK